MRTPALPILLAYAFGAGIGHWTGGEALLPGITLGCLAAGICWARKSRQGMLWTAFWLAGFANMLLQTVPLKGNDLRFVAPGSEILAQVRGSLCRTPRQSSFLRDEALVVRYLAEVQIQKVRFGKADWQPAIGRVLLTTPELPEKLYGGQPVELTGVLGPPPGAAAEGLFDYAAYLRLRGVRFRIRCASAGDIVLLGTNVGPGAADTFLGWARATLSRGLAERDETLRLLWSMTLGVQEELPAEAFQPFLVAGTLHVFAISGLHVALIGWVILQTLTLLRIPRPFPAAVMVVFIWAYTGATGWQPSAIRATLMTTLLAGGIIARRPTNLTNSLFAAALLILAWDPRQMFGAGFQLSFLVVLMIALLVPACEAVQTTVVDSILRKDRLLPEKLLPSWKSVPKGVLMPSYMVVATTIAACLGSAPLTAHYFHLASIDSIFANLAVVPLSGLALGANVASLALCLTPLCEPLNQSAWILMRGMGTVSEWFAARSALTWRVAALPWAGIALYYLTIFKLLRVDLDWRFSRVTNWILVPCGIAWLAWNIAVAQTTVKLTILATQGGMSIFADAPGRARDLLVDCGDKNNAERLTIPFLQAQGVNQLHSMLLTHGDARHVTGALAIHEAFRTSEVLVSGLSFRSGPYRNIVAQLGSSPGLIKHVHHGDSRGPWRVLHPASTDKFSRADDATIVLSADFGGSRVLLASDLGGQGQARLLERHPRDLHADILIGGLATDGTSLGEAFLDAVCPKLILLCGGRELHRESALRTLKRRLSGRGIVTWCTEDAGSVTIEMRNGQWHARSMRGDRLKGSARKS